MSKKEVKTTTVKELIEMLQEADPELPVVFAYEFGDRCNTIIAGRIRQADVKTVRYSDYHKQFVVTDDNEETDPEETTETFVLE